MAKKKRPGGSSAKKRSRAKTTRSNRTTRRRKTKASPAKRGRPSTPRGPASRRTRPTARSRGELLPDARGLGPDAGGQSGDTEALSRFEIADSESVEELLEEGQSFEAGIVSGVENAPDADRGPIRTREVPEDDVPQEYLDDD